MATNQQSQDFSAIAGQLIASGVGTSMPYVGLEEGTKNVNLSNIGGLSAKIKDVFIRDTRVFGNPIDGYFTKWHQRFGAGMEQAMMGPADNSKIPAKSCMPWGSAPLTAQTNWANFAYNVPITIRDHEVDGSVLDEGMLGSYVAAKLKTPLAMLAKMKYRAEIQLLSDVIDGTRTIESNSASDGTGASVQYSPTIKGYAGVVVQSGVQVPPVERGSLITPPAIDSILAIAQSLQGQAADFAIPSKEGNKAGIETFSTSKPLCFMETKVLNSFESAFVNGEAANNASVYGYSFRDFIRTFAELVEIDTFAALPASESYVNQRLGAVLIDRDALIENVKWSDVESFRCTNERATGYSYQGMSVLSIAEMLPSCALTFKTAARSKRSQRPQKGLL